MHRICLKLSHKPLHVIYFLGLTFNFVPLILQLWHLDSSQRDWGCSGGSSHPRKAQKGIFFCIALHVTFFLFLILHYVWTHLQSSYSAGSHFLSRYKNKRISLGFLCDRELHEVAHYYDKAEKLYAVFKLFTNKKVIFFLPFIFFSGALHI